MNLHARVQDKPLLGQWVSKAGTNCSRKAPHVVPPADGCPLLLHVATSQVWWNVRLYSPCGFRDR